MVGAVGVVAAGVIAEGKLHRNAIVAFLLTFVLVQDVLKWLHHLVL